ncbi:MAG: hypothetical protein SFX73_22630 [Kofleriaceae bacterium]|nr:hypothetical protein [Kofleriaceae bacterium]
MIRHAWLQKHPSPSASAGEFHWHPAADDRELRASLVERARGVEPPSVIWELMPGRVSWAQTFTATAPHDHRRYTGLVLTVVERAGASVADLLDELALPAAGPWSDGAPVSSVAALDAFAASDLAWLARTLLSDGGEHAANIGAGYFDALPAAIAALEVLLPAGVHARTRRGVWSALASGAAREADRVALLVARACIAPASRAGQGWRLLCELATATQRSVDEVAARLATLDGIDLAATLHAWGRGRTKRSIADISDQLALRVLSSLIADRDPAPHLAAARWHALLPSERRAALFETCSRRYPSLRAIAGDVHA